MSSCLEKMHTSSETGDDGQEAPSLEEEIAKNQPRKEAVVVVTALSLIAGSLALIMSRFNTAIGQFIALVGSFGMLTSAMLIVEYGYYERLKK